MPRRLAALLTALLVAAPATAAAQVEPEPIPPPWPPPRHAGPIAIEDYRLDVTIDGQIATTRIGQSLRNDGTVDAEAVFVHPLPADAAVTDLTLWIDGEPVAAEILDAGEARQTYEEIVAWMRDPALLEFADQGLVKASVYPVPPGGERRVEMEFTQVLPADHGLVRYTHPLGREVADVIEHATARIEISAAEEIKSVYSPTHEVSVDRTSPTTAVVSWENGDEAPASDLIVYYSTGADAIGAHLVTFRDPGSDDPDGFFLLLISPGLVSDAGAIVPKDVLLVLDTSGSMEGDKFRQAQEAARIVLGLLNPDDRFGLIGFDSVIEPFDERLIPASRADDALGWIDGLTADGSTDIDSALAAAFQMIGRDDGERPAYVLFLTDGLPTEGEIDTPDILANAAERAPQRAALFAFGVGWDVDTILLDGLARRHHGSTTYVAPDEEIDTAVTGLYERVSAPVLVDITVAAEGVRLLDRYPDPPPDLFSGQQLVLVGRYPQGGTGAVTLSGTVRGEPVEYVYDDLRFVDDGGSDALPRLWATRKIGQLLQSMRLDGPNDETIAQIVDLSIRYGVVTPYTSFLVTEPAPFGAAERDRIIDEEAASTTTMPASGEAAFEAADTAGNLADSGVAAGTGGYGDLIRVAGARTFRLSEGVWIDTAWDPDLMEPVAVPFLSPDYFDLAAADAGIGSALAVGEKVLVVWDGVAYQVVGSDEPGDTVDLPTGFEVPDDLIARLVTVLEDLLASLARALL